MAAGSWRGARRPCPRRPRTCRRTPGSRARRPPAALGVRSGRSTADSRARATPAAAIWRSTGPGRNGSSTAPARRCWLADSRAFAVARSATTSMPIDEPPKRGLTMYGPLEADPRPCRRRAATRGNAASPAAAMTAAEGELVHAERRARRPSGRCSGARPGRARACSVPSSPGPPWQQTTATSTLEAVGLAEPPAVGRRSRPRARAPGGAASAPRGTPSTKAGRLERRVDLEPVARLGPVEGPTASRRAAPARERPGGR